MQNYLDIFLNGYKGYAGYLWNDIINPNPRSYFYWLITVSLFFFFVELISPWRKKQKVFREDFWLDFFYMFFNFFLFSLIIYNAASDVVVHFFNDIIKGIFSFDLQAMNPLQTLPLWAILIIGFLVRDFVQWWIHRLLHKSKRLWEFHKVHHSVAEMGFAAHLRYHWMENIVYRTLEYIPLALLGIGLHDFFIIHIFTLAWGHYNHSNVSIDKKVVGSIFGAFVGFMIAFSYADISLLVDPSIIAQIGVILAGSVLGYFIIGPFSNIIFNSPEMHIWHHSHDLPADRRTGVNFGLTLAIWDYIWGTDYIPENGRDIKLGFPGVEKFPQDFISQNLNGLPK